MHTLLPPQRQNCMPDCVLPSSASYPQQTCRAAALWGLKGTWVEEKVWAKKELAGVRQVRCLSYYACTGC
jgi:hypothetical protein